MMTVFRCATLYVPDPDHGLFTASCHLCSILNGMSNIVVGSAPLALSSSWFSPGERVTATTVAQVFNGLGTGMSFLLASQVVRPIDNLVGKHKSISDVTNLGHILQSMEQSPRRIGS